MSITFMNTEYNNQLHRLSLQLLIQLTLNKADQGQQLLYHSVFLSHLIKNIIIHLQWRQQHSFQNLESQSKIISNEHMSIYQLLMLRLGIVINLLQGICKNKEQKLVLISYSKYLYEYENKVIIKVYIFLYLVFPEKEEPCPKLVKLLLETFDELIRCQSVNQYKRSPPKQSQATTINLGLLEIIQALTICVALVLQFLPSFVESCGQNQTLKSCLKYSAIHPANHEKLLNQIMTYHSK